MKTELRSQTIFQGISATISISCIATLTAMYTLKFPEILAAITASLIAILIIQLLVFRNGFNFSKSKIKKEPVKPIKHVSKEDAKAELESSLNDDDEVRL